MEINNWPDRSRLILSEKQTPEFDGHSRLGQGYSSKHPIYSFLYIFDKYV